MNIQQLRDLVQKAYGKQKGLRKERKTPAVLDFNTQHQELALEGTQRQDMLSHHTGSGMHPRPTENETRTLEPDLNRGMTDGMDHVDVNAHLDDTGISHGTKQAWERSWNPTLMGIQWELQGKRQTHPGTISPRNRRKNSPRLQSDQAQTESIQERKTPPALRLTEDDGNDDEGVLSTKRGR